MRLRLQSVNTPKIASEDFNKKILTKLHEKLQIAAQVSGIDDVKIVLDIDTIIFKPVKKERHQTPVPQAHKYTSTDKRVSIDGNVLKPKKLPTSVERLNAMVPDIMKQLMRDIPIGSLQ